ncbi:PREDICTED: LEAF RUST 10 DISEASE-RESISTANCE LOCUS RECEPTOR-LIKE PROTEIN KINASE-like 2.1 [Prunus mume]|uniref:LEAF RUST 10 DISEASE-RESISTANCE LOCUS RECEPTOR-LIKE PROTEIN KINASE-like 2.1 n=1 Tax=Prunus mume TaxID=102107 RepID=A0ABM0NST3_PRUMU|nr:PREDICTED: LEAF RUST 10 DISEASE-RESISTANCE LOCUS RECEPTOR-LIKE PROTEIN KINASE-like 2.1 [Prunus mume]
MQILLFQSSNLLLLTISFFISINIQFCLCGEDPQYANCRKAINCGGIEDIWYPFWGVNRASYCGKPGFEVQCLDNVPVINMVNTSFRILEMNPKNPRTVKVARQDYWSTIYPQSTLVNTSINVSLSNYASGLANLTFYYGCNTSTPSINSQVCTINGSDVSVAFHQTGDEHPVANDTCKTEVLVPVFKTAALALENNQTSVKDAVDEGFELGLQIDNDQSFWTGVGITIGVICIIFISRKRKFFLKRYFKTEHRYELDIEQVIQNYGSFTPKRYSYSDVKKLTNSFKDKVGKGGYGTVYKGTLPDGHLVAVKVLNEPKGNGEDFINEVASISRTSHVNIVKLSGFCYERHKRALIYEFMPNGSLDKFIHKQGSSNTNFPRLEWKMLFEISVGVARGLEYLHRGCNTRILHFDIKPQNILLDKDFWPKISDFGLAKLCKTEESIVSMLGARGTAGYMAPEVFSRNFGGISPKSDVYSYGMLVLEMVGARKNLDYGGSHTSELFPHNVYKDLELEKDEIILEGISEGGKEVARKLILISLWCIQTIPSDRPSMSKVVEMLEGPLHSLQIAPKPFLFSSPISGGDSSQPSVRS